MSKVIERVVHTQLSIPDQLGYLYKYQYVFRRGHSTQQAIPQFNDWVLEAMDRGKVTGPLFVDISKAFDSLNRKVLLGKSVSPIISCWKTSRILINGELSDCRAITHGVPQESILGPLSFNIYVLNSLPDAVKNAQVILHADDKVWICTASTSVELQAILVQDFNWIRDGYNENNWP